MDSQKKINVALVTPTLTAGGAERVITFLAKQLNPEKFKVTLVIFGYEKDNYYDISGVNAIFLNKSRVLLGVFSFIKFIRTNKPDIVLTVIGHLNTLAAFSSIFFPKTKFIAREVSVLSIMDKYSSKSNAFFDFLYARRFNFFDAIICQSKDMSEDLIDHYKVNQKSIKIINNPITDKFVPNLKIKMPSDVLRLVTVGRLDKEKGHARILKVLSKLQRPFHYTLIGDGPEKEAIFSLIKEYDLSSKTTYIEFTDKVNEYLSKNDVFIQGSFVEGFPNALLESCAVGTPTIAFYCPGGLKEIIIKGVNGFVAKDEVEFLNLLQDFNVSDWDLREVSQSVYKKFKKEKILKQYEALFLELVN